MAESADAELLAPKGNADAGSEECSDHGGFASEIHLARLKINLCQLGFMVWHWLSCKGSGYRL
jgi:hypothetical protein